MEYFDRYYTRAHSACTSLSANKAEKARSLANWRGTVSQRWRQVNLQSEDVTAENEVKAGDELPVRVKVRLKDLRPEDVAVEVMYGALNPDGEIMDGQIMRLSYQSESSSMSIFEGSIPCHTGGRQGYAVRVRPDHPDLVHPFTPLLITWE